MSLKRREKTLPPAMSHAGHVMLDATDLTEPFIYIILSPSCFFLGAGLRGHLVKSQ